MCQCHFSRADFPVDTIYRNDVCLDPTSLIGELDLVQRVRPVEGIVRLKCIAYYLLPLQRNTRMAAVAFVIGHIITVKDRCDRLLLRCDREAQNNRVMECGPVAVILYNLCCAFDELCRIFAYDTINPRTSSARSFSP